MVNILELIIGMIFILASSMVFCNALEHLGSSLGISEGVTGSIFVAVGTALPETIVPIIALFGVANIDADEIGTGAILGPPLMLSTLSVALMAFAVLKSRGLSGMIRPEKTGLKRDFMFFCGGYFLAVALAVIHNFYVSRLLDIFIVGVLVFGYFIYVLLTLKASKHLVADGHATEAEDELMIKQYLKLPNNLFTVLLQSVVGLAGLIYFAHIFINGITGTSHMLHFPAFLLSVILIPVATELPEKVNSILWIRRGKDTLAMGNITGAMVFQGLLLPPIGILFTPWVMSYDKAVSSFITFVAVFWMIYHIRRHNNLKVKHFILNAVLYIICIGVSLGVYHG